MEATVSKRKLAKTQFAIYSIRRFLGNTVLGKYFRSAVHVQSVKCNKEMCIMTKLCLLHHQKKVQNNNRKTMQEMF